MSTLVGNRIRVAVTGWVVVLAVYDAVTLSSVVADLGSRAVAALALGLAGLALAALASRLGSAASPGAAGMGVTAGLGVAWHALPSGWLEALPPTKVLGPTTIVVAVLTVAIVTQEPAR